MERRNIQSLSLFDLNQLVKNTIATHIQKSYWVVAEISEINEHPNGHCYLELCQKDESSNDIKAKARATIWANTYRTVKPYFETTTRRPLTKGINILVGVYVVFHEIYGYSLNIIDIEPSYTLGNIELKRRETVQRLIEDGVAEMNHELQFTDIPKRIAIVSSAKAAGLQDFINQLDNNTYGYRFTYRLFGSTMQGNEAEASIIQSLNNINAEIANFDAVVIVRGGGSQSDLACFDSYLLALNIAQFPIPVITGIGHDKDQSVADMVAKVSVKTPTAAAEYLISLFATAEERVNSALLALTDLAEALLTDSNEGINGHKLALSTITTTYLLNKHLEMANRIKLVPYSTKKHIAKHHATTLKQERNYLMLAQQLISENHRTTTNRAKRIEAGAKTKLLKTHNQIDLRTNLLHHTNPQTQLDKGYSITYMNGRVITDPNMVSNGCNITTLLKHGKLHSTVHKTSNEGL